jgi:hypothetical protein
MLYLKAGQRHYLYDKETKTIDVFDMFGNFLHRGLDQYDPKVIIVKRFVPVILKARLRTAGISHEECLDTQGNHNLGNCMAVLYHRYNIDGVTGQLIISVYAINDR